MTLVAVCLAVGVGSLLLQPSPALASQSPELASVEPDERAPASAPRPDEVAAPEAQALAARFEAHGYDWSSVLSGDAVVPEVTVRTLPTDLARLRDTELKKSLFFRSLLPAILQVNREIAAVRTRLRNLRSARDAGTDLDPVDQAWLAKTAESYGADPDDFDALMLRVDGVPPSLVLAQAAEESGWGTSRFARLGNALFGQYTWNDDHDGIVPRDNGGDANRRIRAFASLKAAIASYIHNLNSHPAYARFRARRAQGASAYDLAASLTRYSARGADYVDTIRVIMRANRLDAVDQTELAHEVQLSRYP